MATMIMPPPAAQKVAGARWTLYGYYYIYIYTYT